MHTKIEEWDGFTMRVKNALAERGVTTMEQLAGLTDKDILVTKNLGEKSLVEIREELKAWGKPKPTEAARYRATLACGMTIGPLVYVERLPLIPEPGYMLETRDREGNRQAFGFFDISNFTTYPFQWTAHKTQINGCPAMRIVDIEVEF